MGTPPGAPPRLCQAQDTHDDFICNKYAESGRLYCEDHSEERTFAEETDDYEAPDISGLPFATNRSPPAGPFPPREEGNGEGRCGEGGCGGEECGDEGCGDEGRGAERCEGEECDEENNEGCEDPGDEAIWPTPPKEEDVDEDGDPRAVSSAPVDDAPLGGDCQIQNRNAEYICAEQAEPGCKYCQKHQDRFDEIIHSREQADGWHGTICQSRCDCGTPGYIRTRCFEPAVEGTNWCKEHTFPSEPGCMF
jgi:hypothetical protein